MESKISHFISQELLDELTILLNILYDLSEEASATEYDDNYTFSCNLYRKTLNAINIRFKNNSDIENYSANNKAILKVVSSSLFLRFLTTTPTEHRRKHGSDILEMFNISNGKSLNLDLFENNLAENNSYGFFFFSKPLDADLPPCLNLHIFDESWKLKVEWSSDTVQNKVKLEVDEISKELPEARPLRSGNKLLTPVKPVVADKKKSS